METSTSPLPGQTPGIWQSSVPGEWGIWPLPAWGGENWTRRVRSQMIIFRAPKSLTAIKHVFGRDERRFKGRGIAFVSDWVTKKGLQKLGTDRQIRRQGRAFKHYFGPRGREFKRSNLQKFKCPQMPVVCPGKGGGGGLGMLKYKKEAPHGFHGDVIKLQGLLNFF